MPPHLFCEMLGSRSTVTDTLEGTRKPRTKSRQGSGSWEQGQDDRIQPILGGTGSAPS